MPAQVHDLPAGDVVTSDPALIRALMDLGESAWCVVLDEMPREAKRGLRETLARLIAGRAEDHSAILSEGAADCAADLSALTSDQLCSFFCALQESTIQDLVATNEKARRMAHFSAAARSGT